MAQNTYFRYADFDLFARFLAVKRHNWWGFAVPLPIFLALRKEFIINILFLVFINLLIKPFFIFGIDLGVQNRVGEDYGLYFALFNFAYLFQILNDFGIQNFNNQTISQHPQMLPKYFPNLLALKAIMGLVYFSLTMLAAVFIAGYEQAQLGLLGILLLNQILIQLIFFFRSNISGLGYFRTDSVLSALDKLLMIFTCGFVLWVHPVRAPFTIFHFAWAQTVALILTLFIAVFYFNKYLDAPIRLRLKKVFVLSLFRKSVPFALIILLMGAFTRLDGVLLERILPEGKFHAEIYAGAYRLLDAANMFGFLFATLLLPMFSRMIKAKEDLSPLIRLSFGLLWIGSFTIATSVYISREPLMRLLYGSDWEYRWEVLGILFWTIIPVCSIYVFGTVLTARGRLMPMNRFFLWCIALNVVLCIFLIPRYAAEGTAWAALLTQAFVALGLMHLAWQDKCFSWAQLSLPKLALFSALTYGLSQFLCNTVTFAWWLKFSSVLVLGLLGLLVFFFFDIKKFIFHAIRNKSLDNS